MVGHLYSDGQGVPQNDAEAYKWYSLAAKSLETAATSKEEAAALTKPDQIAEGERLAAKWRPNLPEWRMAFKHYKRAIESGATHCNTYGT